MFRRSKLFRSIVETFVKDSFKVSRLSNGLRVITTDGGTGITGIGVFIMNGTKYEDETNTGSASMLESLSLYSNQHYSSREISQTLGVFGNAFKALNNKEVISFLTMMPSYHRKDGLALLNAIALHPTKDPEAFEAAKQSLMERYKMFQLDPTSVCLEMVHEAAWDGKGLGNPLFPSEDKVQNLTLDAVHKFHRKYARPDRTVVSATGIYDHDAFALEVEQQLQFNCDSADTPLNIPKYDYKGGTRKIQIETAPKSLNKFEEKLLTHIGLFFQSVTTNHPDYYTVSIIQNLLGGGTSFSSGGPGKGMQTKFFREVLNRECNINGLECITAWYRDCGLLGVYGTIPLEHTKQLLDIILYQAATIPDRVTKQHLEMAKNQLASSLVILQESAETLLFNMGCNLIVNDHIITHHETATGSRNVQLSDLTRVCDEMKTKPITIAAYGETSMIPSHDMLADTIRKIRSKS